ncbi:MAG: hypothetical protein K2W95_28625, partial [Candidatus Obscuribacterales bacterium]|nr:hypothetical protein [Candidatus Obscuribacterales bacterium]
MGSNRNGSKALLRLERLESLDLLSAVMIDPPAQTVFDDVSRTFDVTVVLDGASNPHHGGAPVILTVHELGTGPGFATAGADFVGKTVEFTLENTPQSQHNRFTVPITIIGDTAVEGNEVFRISIRLADGAPNDFNIPQPHSYVDITLRDPNTEEGGGDDPTLENQPPFVPGGEYYLTEGDTLNVVRGFSDPDSSSFTVYADYGSGEQVVSTGASKTFPLSQLYSQDSSDQPGGYFPIVLRVTDDTGLQGLGLVRVYVANALETPDIGGNITITAGSGITRTGTFVDPGADSPWSVTLDYGDGTVESFTTATHSFPLSHVYGTPGSYIVTATVRDDDTERSNEFCVTVEAPPVENLPPQIPNAEYHIKEGETLNVQHGFTDPDSTSWTVTADYGNGPQPVTLSGTTFDLIKLYAQDSSDQPGGYFPIFLTVTDEHGNSASALVKVFVENVLEQPNVGGDATIPTGGSINRTVTFVDPGADSPWSVTVNYGDGTVDNFTNADKDFPIGHTYNVPGNYTVTVTVRDDDTERSNAFNVTVEAPPVENQG